MTRSWHSILLVMTILAAVLCSWGQVVVSVRFGPPALPVYAQPLCPGPGYIWAPGYWAWSPDVDDYYWVPGTWVLAPQPGFLWTPGYWGFSTGLYFWHPGYWGPVVGFYGGINYGFGYPGHGYYGGYWHGRDFYYNRAVNNVNLVNVHNVYNQTVVNNNVAVNRVSYNGGTGGVQARPTSAELAAEREHHIAATSVQVQHEHAARSDPAQFVARNQGHPAVVATPRPGALNAREATRANLPAANRHAPNPQTSGVARAPQNNPQQAHAPQNVPRPPQNNNSQAQAHENAPRPNNNVHQAPPRPSTAANNRQGPQAKNVPHPRTAQRAVPPPNSATPQQQARQPHNPPHEAAPGMHASARSSAPNVTQRSPGSHQAEPPRQMAARQAPPPKGHEGEQRH